MQSLGDEHLNRFIALLVEEIKNKLPDLYVAAVFGSRLRGDFSNTSDLDLLVILCRDDELSLRCVRKYIMFMNILKDIGNRLGDTIVIVPVNILKKFLSYITDNSKRGKIVHLFLYLTVEDFMRGENPWVIKGICEDAKEGVIWGKRETLDMISRRVNPALSFESAWYFLLRRLIQSHICVKYFDEPKELMIEFGRHMLKYCIEHLLRALLIKDFKVGLNVLRTPKDVRVQATLHGLDNLVTLLTSLEEERPISIEDIRAMYEKAFHHFISIWESPEENYTEPRNKDVMLDVPSYKQVTFGSCGPSSLMMVLSYYRQAERSKELEIRLWREAILLPLRITGVFGLAVSAAKFGLYVVILKERPQFVMPFIDERIMFYESLGGKVDVTSTLLTTFNEQKANAMRHKNIRTFFRKVSLDDIFNAVRLGLPPIVLINLSLINPEKPYTHWIVIRGFSKRKGEIYINDPETGTMESVPFERIEKALNVGMETSESQMLLITDKKALFSRLIKRYNR